MLLTPYAQMPSYTSTLISRFAGTAPWASRHLVLSLLLAALIAWLVFGIWFPTPYLEISGGLILFTLILGVDIVCGPLLTLLLLHPSKSRRAMAVDIVLIACLQLGALIYGLHVLSHARPLAIVFEVDRFRAISYADIQTSDLANAPAWVRAWGLSPPRVLGIRTARSSEEKIDSVNASLQGVEPSQRPNWWQDYALSTYAVKERAQPLALLQKLNPGRIHAIQSAAAKAAKNPENGEVTSPNALLWLPLVSRRSLDWVVFLDPETARIRGFVHADGFGSE